MRTRLIVAAAAAAASLAACGGEPEPTGDQREASNRQALLDYARCMRENGVDMPDPQFDGGRVTMRRSAGADRDELRAAEERCAKHREAVEPPELPADQREELREAALAHAKCMREHGIDFPDPTFDENGGARVQIGPESGIDPDSQEFRDAQEACRDKMPDGPRTTGAEKP
jgi:hypothetical protein